MKKQLLTVLAVAFMIFACNSCTPKSPAVKQEIVYTQDTSKVSQSERNQLMIIANQEAIIKNQEEIIANQKTSLKNQGTMLKNEDTIKQSTDKTK